MKKLKPKTVKLIYAAFVVAGLAVLLITSGKEGGSTAGTYAGCGILVAGILFHFFFYKCPNCGKHLSKGNGTNCPYCGAIIDEDDDDESEVNQEAKQIEQTSEKGDADA